MIVVVEVPAGDDGAVAVPVLGDAVHAGGVLVDALDRGETDTACATWQDRHVPALDDATDVGAGDTDDQVGDAVA